MPVPEQSNPAIIVTVAARLGSRPFKPLPAALCRRIVRLSVASPQLRGRCAGPGHQRKRQRNWPPVGPVHPMPTGGDEDPVGSETPADLHEYLSPNRDYVKSSVVSCIGCDYSLPATRSP